MERFYRAAPIIEIKAMKDDDEDEDKAFIVLAEISNDQEDAHDTRMDANTTLKNFVQDANQGVPTMDIHSKKNGIGLTSEAMLKDNRVMCDLSVYPSEPLSAEASYPNTDVIIRMIRRKVIKAVSVGAYGGIHRCNICGNDMWRSWSCRHWPGIVYIIEDEGSDKKREIKCVPVIEGAHLGEVSFVPIGSNPDAKVTARAAQHAEEGLLSSKHITHINRMFSADIDLRSANDSNIPIIGGFDSMDLKEAQAEITRLEGEVKTLKADKQELERSVEELQTAKATLDIERQDLRTEILSLYREWRGDKMTGDQLKGYEKRLDSFDHAGLKMEREQMSELVSKMEPPATVESGQQTHQEDKTKAEPGGDAERAMSQGLPPWAVARKSE